MKIKPSDINLRLEEKVPIVSCPKCLGKYNAMGCVSKFDINQRLSKLLNILEEPIDFKIPPTVEFSKKVGYDLVVYKKGFRDGEEAHKKRMRELFTKDEIKRSKKKNC